MEVEEHGIFLSITFDKGNIKIPHKEVLNGMQRMHVGCYSETLINREKPRFENLGEARIVACMKITM